MVKAKTSKVGAVSIFIVIFTTLLVGIIVLGFIRLMLLDQQRAINSDLANSAYDSALAGLEDAKRAIIKYEREICPSSQDRCNEIRQRYLEGQHCGAVQSILNNGSDDREVKIVTTKSGSGDSDLEQAYTCAKIRYQTDNYIREIKNSGEHIMLPLNATKKFQEIILEWSGEGKSFNTNPSASVNDLGAKTNWPANNGNLTPALMLQFISGGEAPTLFLRPKRLSSTTGTHQPSDADMRIDRTEASEINRDFKQNNPPVSLIDCSVGANKYRCLAKVILPEEIAPGSTKQFLKISKLYSTEATINFRFENRGVDTPQFNGIQPEIDVTGRANYIFRRIKARVEFTGGRFPYPTGALSVTGSEGLCKNFEVTEKRIKQAPTPGTSCVDSSSGPRP